MKKSENKEMLLPQAEADRITAVYYTDPLCCWSWALEPEWKKLLKEHGDLISWRYCFGGLIQDWAHYQDPVNTINRPAQMGPLWMEVMHRTGRAVNYNIWMQDPPSSSYPASIAIKSAEMQSPAAGIRYFRAAQEAVMCRGRNIARPEVLVEIAEDVALKDPGLLSVEQFLKDLRGDESRDAFREDLKKARYNRIGRFPTITLQKKGGAGVILTGYRPYEALRKSLLKLIHSE